ncbi:AAA family ATPase [Roseinatronobacter monicus]|uniref:AAA15 family ATPase/GTPase n=1 Tax=Roseinatronobacter monicus TaxID=393481 RepID=A0A543KBJ9_9RHOB|nr:ATP-binding protein [Roseinatronobacter monicus]TQM92449.1 AAA15 family ATPase/GTPase [Roseinatronobacter monicus]
MPDLPTQDLPTSSAKEIKIVSFRGLKDVTLEELGQVNLLVGGNNSGKTSVLEAIAVLHAGIDLRSWLNVAYAREVRTFMPSPHGLPVLDIISWMFPSNDSDLWDHTNAGPIELHADMDSGACSLFATLEPIAGYHTDEELRRMGRSYFVEDQDEAGEPVPDTGIEVSIDYKSPNERSLQNKESEDFKIWSKLGMRTLAGKRKIGIPVEYVPPYGHRSSSHNLSSLSKAQRSDSIDDLNELMSELDARIAGVELVPSENRHRPVIAIRLKDRSLVPASVMGDGVRRGLSIALSILAAKNGVVLIDEMEAGFHVRAFSKVFDWLMRATKRYNVQVFATSHSLEAIEEISRSNKDAHGLSAYLLGGGQGQVVKRFTAGMLQRLVVDSGMDIRF